MKLWGFVKDAKSGPLWNRPRRVKEIHGNSGETSTTSTSPKPFCGKVDFHHRHGGVGDALRNRRRIGAAGDHAGTDPVSSARSRIDAACTRSSGSVCDTRYHRADDHHDSPTNDHRYNDRGGARAAVRNSPACRKLLYRGAYTNWHARA